uniref:Core Histone H2A/H2B/H3 domain-containing protein n=1 Tax=Anopheles atroparvus TaxID=41427 RepID=A0AAG5DAP5_ANOAO
TLPDRTYVLLHSATHPPAGPLAAFAAKADTVAGPKLPPLQKEMWKLQNSTKLLIPKSSICRVIREVMLSYGQYRITLDALAALHESSEMYLVNLFEASHRCALHRQRVTLMPKDMQLALFLRGDG